MKQIKKYLIISPIPLSIAASLAILSYGIFHMIKNGPNLLGNLLLICGIIFLFAAIITGYLYYNPKVNNPKINELKKIIPKTTVHKDNYSPDKLEKISQKYNKIKKISHIRWLLRAISTLMFILGIIFMIVASHMIRPGILIPLGVGLFLGGLLVFGLSMLVTYCTGKYYLDNDNIHQETINALFSEISKKIAGELLNSQHKLELDIFLENILPLFEVYLLMHNQQINCGFYDKSHDHDFNKSTKDKLENFLDGFYTYCRNNNNNNLASHIPHYCNEYIINIPQVQQLLQNIPSTNSSNIIVDKISRAYEFFETADGLIK